MKARLLSHDRFSGITRTFHYDEMTKQSTIKVVQDVHEHLQDNTKMRNAQAKGWKGSFHHVARVPLVIIEQWWKELGSDPLSKENKQWLIARLNSRDWCKLRTKEGVL